MGVLYSHYIIPRENTIRPSPDQVIALIKVLQDELYVPQNVPDGIENVGGSNPTFVTDEAKLQLAAQPQPTRPQAAKAGFFSWLFSRGARIPPSRPLGSERPFTYPPTDESLSALSGSGSLIRWGYLDCVDLGLKYPLQYEPDPNRRPWYSLEIHLVDDFVNLDTGTYSSTVTELITKCSCGTDLEYQARGIMFGWDTRIHRACPLCGKLFRPQDQNVDVVIGATGETYYTPAGLCYRFSIVVDCEKDSPSYSQPKDPKATPEFLKICQDALGMELYEVSYYC